MPEELLQRISEHCPNSVLSAHLNTTGIINDVPEMADFDTSLAKCYNVKNLLVASKTACAFPSRPRNNLGRLYLWESGQTFEYQDFLRLVNNSGGLRFISVRSARISRKSLQKLAVSNKLLERVVFNVYHPEIASDDVSATYMIDVIDCSRDCHFLKDMYVTTAQNVEISWQAEIADRCVPLRIRNITISIVYVQYLS